jgi:two-component system response regulator AtoC
MSPVAAANLPFRLPPEHVIFGRSDAMQIVRSKLDRIANTNLPVLIQGENGTGKEIIAKVIHSHSPWHNGPFVRVSCPAMTGTLVASELFDYEKTVFTGAKGFNSLHPEPNRGTLFLDELGEMDPALQTKLLQLLQDCQFCRIRHEENQLEARLICSTNRELQDEIALGSFRQDLFYRINILNLRMPALRERRADLTILTDYFLELYNEQYNCKAKPLSSAVVQILSDYHWPGNIRELENLIKRYVVLGTEESIASELAPRDGRQFMPDIPLDGNVSLKEVTRQAVRELERHLILRSLQTNNWNRKRVARALKISYRALLYKIRDAGLTSVRGARRNPIPINGIPKAPAA